MADYIDAVRGTIAGHKCRKCGETTPMAAVTGVALNLWEDYDEALDEDVERLGIWLHLRCPACSHKSLLLSPMEPWAFERVVEEVRPLLHEHVRRSNPYDGGRSLVSQLRQQATLATKMADGIEAADAKAHVSSEDTNR